MRRKRLLPFLLGELTLVQLPSTFPLVRPRSLPNPRLVVLTTPCADLTVGPLVEQLAAGNRVIIKPSEFTPACAKHLKTMINATFPRDLVEVVIGGVELGIEFTKLKWDHLLVSSSFPLGLGLVLMFSSRPVHRLAYGRKARHGGGREEPRSCHSRARWQVVSSPVYARRQ